MIAFSLRRLCVNIDLLSALFSRLSGRKKGRLDEVRTCLPLQVGVERKSPQDHVAVANKQSKRVARDLIMLMLDRGCTKHWEYSLL